MLLSKCCPLRYNAIRDNIVHAVRPVIMSATPDLPTRAFPTATSFEAFLKREHLSAPGIYLKLAKKASGIPSITGAEAVEIALCYGWIDGRANSIDDKWWTVRFTPRRAKSIWSKKNVGTVARLIEEGRMRAAGLAAVEAAKADGRWDRAYAGPATMVTPADFVEALAAEPAAEAYFESLNKSEKYAALMQLATVSDKNRSRKIDALVQTMAVGKTPGATKQKAILVKGTPKRKAKVGSVAVQTKGVPAAPRRVKPLENDSEHQQTSRPKREGLRKRT
jgi:uncharacterized protein YdeI (YjbR/CyaY-like superfamily)